MQWKQSNGRVCYLLHSGYDALANFTKGQKQLVKALWQSFDQEFKPDADNIQQRGHEVREEIALAKAHADRQHQDLQKKEGEAAKKRWESLTLLTKTIFGKIEERQVQRDQLEASKFSYFII